MLLSEVLKFIDNVEVLREGSFTSLGLAVSKCDEDLLSFIESENI